MDEMENVQIDTRNQYSALKWGILLLIYGLVISIIYKIGAADLINPQKYIDLGLWSLVGIAYISTWIIRIIVIWQIVKIAKFLNRNVVFWAIFALVSPPFSLIFISFCDYKIYDKGIEKILDSLRLDYKAELVHLKNTLDVSKTEFEEIELKIKDKYNSKLHKKISKLKSNSVSETKVNQIYEKNSTNTDNAESLKCPACGYNINENTVICP